MRFLEKKKIYHLISKKKYSIIILRKNWKNWKLHSGNYQNLIYHFKGPTKDIDFNDFIDVETLFDDIKSKNNKIWRCKKKKKSKGIWFEIR